MILGGLIISCLFAGFRLFRVASLVDDVKTYAALHDGQGPTSRSRSANLALVDTLQLRDSHGQDAQRAAVLAKEIEMMKKNAADKEAEQQK